MKARSPTCRMSSCRAQSLASSRQQALHPQGLLWMVEAEKDRLTKAQHAPCQERRPCGEKAVSDTSSHFQGGKALTPL